MTHRAIVRAVRREVCERVGRRCEYCQHPDRYSSSPLSANTSCHEFAALAIRWMN
jgi:hypothetical protein